MGKIEVGNKFQVYSFNKQNGYLFTMNDGTNQPLVIYLYPKDNSPGCMKEACIYRDDFEKFTGLGILALGISSDNVTFHKKFEEKYNFPFILLADH